MTLDPISIDDDSTDADVFDFVRQFERDRADGVDRGLAEYLARFPGRDEAIATEYLAILAAERTAPPPPAQPRSDESTTSIGPYCVIRPLGAGGQGMVVLAVDTRIGRQVALKVLQVRPGLVSGTRLRRFNREAALLARLDHPGICPIYEADAHEGVPFIAMAYLEGRTLAETIAAAAARDDGASPEESMSTSPPLPPRGGIEVRIVLNLIEGVARALHAAHEAGVVHRDVKPANIMVKPDGQAVVLDLGLAFDLVPDAAPLTVAGELWGTLDYMSPEQREPRGRAPDRRTDVYSLGVVLFECLTLKRPFAAAEALERGRAPAPSARRLNEDVPRDLDVALAVALDPDPNRRYADALEFAEDLRRIREYEPIRARAVPTAVRVWRWAQRHPAPAAGILTTFLALTIGLFAMSVLLGRETRSRREADRERAAKHAAMVTLDGTRLAMVSSQRLATEPTLALLLAIEAANREGPARTDFTDRALREACDAVREVRVAGFDSLDQVSASRDVDISPDGSRLLTCDHRDDVDTATLRAVGSSDEPLLRLVGHEGAVLHARFSRDGTRIATASVDGTARIWNTDGLQLLVMHHPTTVLDAAFDPGGRRLVTVGADDAVRVFDLEGGAQQRLMQGVEGPLLTARFDPDGRRVLAYGRDGANVHPTRPYETNSRVSVWDADSGELLGSIEHEAQVHWAEFHPADGSVLSADASGLVRKSACDGRCLLERRLADTVRCVRSDHSGTRVLVCGSPAAGGAQLWDARDFGQLMTFAGHEGRSVVFGAFAPDDGRVVTAGWDDRVRVWDSRDGREIMALPVGARPDVVAWSGDGRVVACSGRGPTVAWRVDARPGHHREIPSPAGRARGAAVAPRAGVVVTVHEDGSVWLRAVDGSSQPVRCASSGDQVSGIAVSADGKAVAVVRARSVRVVDAADGDVVATRAFDAPGAVLFAPDPSRRVLVLGGGAQTVTLWDSGRDTITRLELPGGERPLAMACRADGRRVAVGTDGGSVVVYSLPSGRAVATTSIPATPGWNPSARIRAVDSLAFVPGGRALGCAGTGGTAVTWALDAATPRILHQGYSYGDIVFDRTGFRCAIPYRFGGRMWLIGTAVDPPDVIDVATHRNMITRASFSPDGEKVITSSLDGETHLLAAATGRRLAALRGNGGAVLSSFCTEDGVSVVTVAADGVIRIWPVDPMDEALRRRPRHMTKDELGRYLTLEAPR